MSNCLQLHHHTVVFNKEQIDGDRLLSEVNRVLQLNEVPEVDKDEVGNCLWWFVSRNCEFFENGDVVIKFGDGRSTHTWRDLGWTVLVLSKFMKSTRRYSFQAAEEGDGFDDVFRLDVVFSPRDVECKVGGDYCIRRKPTPP